MITNEVIIDGDFNSDEVKALRDEADIICTNPPFSLFRDFLAWINPDEKKFLILGTIGAVGYKGVFPLIRDNKIWLGASSGSIEYSTPNGTIQKMGNTCWFTNLNHRIRREELPLLTKAEREYQGVVYKKYYNYDAIDVPETKLIPKDYTGAMGVPVSFLDRYNPEQFEIIGLGIGDLGQSIGIGANITTEQWTVIITQDKNLRKGTLLLCDNNGKYTAPYSRILIKNK